MNQAWQEFISQQHARLQDGTVLHFGDINAELRAARDSTVLCDLNQFGLIRVCGEEAEKFLQSLLSSDIRQVNPGTAQLSSFNTPKGRMLATFLVWQQNGDYLLQLPRSVAATLQKKLAMYVLRAKVKVSDASDELVCLGVAGSEAQALLKQHCNVELAHDWAVAQESGASVLRLAAQRYLLCTTAEQAIALWPRLTARAKPAGAACWDWLNIRAGIPVITPATQEQFVLQMANLDLLGGVSFNKGCYPGQEIVARTHYLGKQKRRMYLAHVATTGTPPAAGNELYSDEMPGQACGMVINTTAAPGGGFDLLAVMKISSHASQQVHLLAPHGPALQFQALPYALPESAE